MAIGRPTLHSESSSLTVSLPHRYGREYADPYLGHGIGPVPGYGVSSVRGGWPSQRTHLTNTIVHRLPCTAAPTTDSRPTKRPASVAIIACSLNFHDADATHTLAHAHITPHHIINNVRGGAVNGGWWSKPAAGARDEAFKRPGGNVRSTRLSRENAGCCACVRVCVGIRVWNSHKSTNNSRLRTNTHSP